jgi:hypothetical protein
VTLPDSDLLSLIGTDDSDAGFPEAGGLGGLSELAGIGFECGRVGGAASGGRSAICRNIDCCCGYSGRGAGTAGLGRLGAEAERPG